MVLGVKLFIDPFIACPSLLVVVSFLGLSVNVCFHLKRLSGDRDNLEQDLTFTFVWFTLNSDRCVAAMHFHVHGHMGK